MKELTVKQQSFLDYLVETGGDPKQAAELAGYANNGHWQVVKALKHEIIDLASNILAQSAPQAAIKLVEVMHSEVPMDSKYLEVIPEELKSLKEIKNLVQSKSLSLREGANWLYYQTGRPISHVGLKKIIDNGRLDKKPK